MKTLYSFNVLAINITVYFSRIKHYHFIRTLVEYISYKGFVLEAFIAHNTQHWRLSVAAMSGEIFVRGCAGDWTRGRVQVR